MKAEPLIILGAIQMALVFAMHQTDVPLPPWAMLSMHMAIIVLAVVTGRAFVSPVAKGDAKAPSPPPLSLLLVLLVAVPSLLAAALFLTGCTPAARSAAAELACNGIRIVADEPGLAPLCAHADEIERAFEDIFATKARRAGPVSDGELYRAIVRRRAAAKDGGS